MASFSAWAAAGPYERIFNSSIVDSKECGHLADELVRDRLFYERALLSPRLRQTRSLRDLDDLLCREESWRRSSMYTDPEWRRSAGEQRLHSLSSPRVISPVREVWTIVSNSRGDVMDTRTIRETYGDQITSRRIHDQYSVKSSVAHDPCAGERVVNPVPVSLMKSPSHHDDFMLDQLRTKTYMDRLDGTDTRSLYLDDPLHSRSSRYLDDPLWRRSRYLDDPHWSSPSRILRDDLWRHPSTNKSSALKDRAWRRSMRAVM